MKNDHLIAAACRDPKFLARFDAKVDRSGECHLWIAGLIQKVVNGRLWR